MTKDKDRSTFESIQSYSNGIQVFYRTVGMVTIIAFIIFGSLIFLLKKVKFNHLEKVGNLTPEGITHLESLISTLEFTTWENHMNKK